MTRLRSSLGTFLAALAMAGFGCLSFAALGRRSRTALRAAPNFGDLLGSMGKMQEVMKKMPELQKRLRETPSTGSALGGRVKVTVSGDLAPLGVEIDEGLMTEGLPAKVLSDAVFMAMKEAHNSTLELSRTELGKFYKDMGVPLPGAGAAGMPGQPAMPASPAPPPPPPMEFDPAGLGTKLVD
mmetsp:Transcript_36299/g.64398  ORF Transcript_36299/g.64398 Transcript_36299/m.64398 type:complete len:183 (-) Transcript_36299:28-576(-)